MCFGMDARIREATYLYEFEGKSQRAEQILLDVLKTGAALDRQDALFYLGKIADMQGNSKVAATYLHQYIASSPNNSEMTYWAANRLSILDPHPTQLVQGSQRLFTPIQRRIPGKNPMLLTSDQMLWQMNGNHMERVRNFLPPKATVLESSNNTLWVFNPDNNYFLELSSIDGSVKSGMQLDAPLLKSFHCSGGEWFVMTTKSIALMRNGHNLWSRDNLRKNCVPISESPPTHQLLLNCPDNALHPIELRDGMEGESIGLLDPIDTVISSPDGIWIANNVNVWFYQPHLSRQPIWQQNFHSIRSLLLFEKRMVVLEGDGSLNFLDGHSGALLSRTRSEPGQMFQTGHRLGILTKDGNMLLLDREGQVLWRYQAGYTAAALPLGNETSLFLPLSNNQVVSLNSQYFGVPKSDLQVRTETLDHYASLGQWDNVHLLADSILKIEAGNAFAWMQLARFYSQQPSGSDSSLHAWSRAARYARSQPSPVQQQVLQSFSHRLGAQWIQYLPVSTQTYPKFFGDAHSLFTIDAGNRSLVALDPSTGQFRWHANTQPLDQGFVTENDGRILVIASGFEASILDLSQKGKQIASLNLPGKVFQVVITHSSIFISTWNGFLLRYQKKGLEPIWSHKVFETGAYLTASENMLYALSLDGDLGAFSLDDGVTSAKIRALPNTPSNLLLSDSLLVTIWQDGHIATYNSHSLQHSWDRSLGTQVFSAQAMESAENGTQLLLGLADQKLVSLDLETGVNIWSVNGKGSVYIQPKVEGNQILIDQAQSILVLDKNSGKRIREFPAPEGAGPVWSNPSMVFYSSPQGLIYAFPLRRQSN